MLEFKDLVSLAKAAIGADKSAPVAYSYEGKNFSYNRIWYRKNLFKWKW